MHKSPLLAAVEIAARFGLHSDEARVLKDANNTIVHLAPLPIVAKVCTSVISRMDDQSAARELMVALHARANGARVLAPSDMLPVEVHKSNSLAVTFWKYVEQVESYVENPAWFGAFVRELHDAMEGLVTTLPRFSTTFAGAKDLLICREGGIAQLSAEDIDVLSEEYVTLLEKIEGTSGDYRLLHGDCRPGNVMWTSRGPLWHDFEAVSYGPKEIDCSAMDEADLIAYGPVDTQLLATVRQLQSVCVAIWCNAQKGRAPEVDEAARYHLEQARMRQSASGAITGRNCGDAGDRPF